MRDVEWEHAYRFPQCARLVCVLVVIGVFATWLRSAEAQQADGQPVQPLPLPPPTVSAAPATTDALLERLRRLEQRLDNVSRQNEDLARENKALAGQVQDLSRRIGAPGPRTSLTGTEAAPRPSGADDFDRESPVSSVAGEGMPPASAGGGSAAGGGDPTTTGRAQVVGNRHRGRIPLLGGSYDFDNDGFRWATQDGEITFGVRALEQFDALIYQNPNQEFASSGFYNPRTRFYFEGQLTRPIAYELSFEETYSTPNLLDSYLNYRFSDGFQLRIGRYKTPFMYEWYRVHSWHLISPERSLFAANFEGGRRFGFMGWGSAFDKRLEYAVGTFNGQRNGFVPYSSHQDVIAFLNVKPFEQWEDSPLRNLQIGGSVDAGYENNPLSPAVLTTSNQPTPAALGVGIPSVPFLAFNNGVVERGERALWELHLAYYYGGLSFMGAWNSGVQGYAMGRSGPPPVLVPANGYFVQAAYILTGETLRDRTLIDPLRPFDLRRSHFGLGAWEVTARYSELALGQQVFTGGFADPNLWTNRAEMVDVGFNWYWNKFVKVYFDWEHAMFGSPVFVNAGSFQKTNNLYWLRFQIMF